MKEKPQETCNQGAIDAWVKNTRLFRQWEDMKKEILLHKWYESEKVGYDIGWERAAVDWMIRYGQGTPPPSRPG